jgi:hypothetical protein
MSKWQFNAPLYEASPMTLNVLETDDNGHIVEKPVVGWSVTTDQGVTVAVAFEYRSSASAAKQDAGKIQLGLTPEQATQLANAMTDTAKDILRGSSEVHGSSA